MNQHQLMLEPTILLYTSKSWGNDKRRKITNNKRRREEKVEYKDHGEMMKEKN